MLVLIADCVLSFLLFGQVGFSVVLHLVILLSFFHSLMVVRSCYERAYG